MRVNSEFERLFGYPAAECVGRKVDDLVAAGSAHALANQVTLAVARGAKQAFETVRHRKDGTPLNVVVLASPIVVNGEQLAVYAFYRDITAEKRVEAELLKAKKLEATGKLAGGIAHDFNNLLTNILGNINLAQMLVPMESPIATPLRQAERMCMTARELTCKFVTFASGGTPLKRLTDIRPLLRESAADMFAGTNLACHMELANDLWACPLDRDQFRHVFDAVLCNAREAMPHGGEVRLAAWNLTPPEAAALLPDANSQAHICIVIQDHGVGIAAEVLPQIFDPYYTTKEMGSQKGMGLGLTVAHSVVKRHGGHIQVTSHPGRGTTVTLCLPAAVP
jgi:PAS domain S-box-containing protein